VLMLRNKDGQRHSFSADLFKRAEFTGLRIHRGAGERTLTEKASFGCLVTTKVVLWITRQIGNTSYTEGVSTSG
jgi:hypothetical protein